jgi:hypothetical protein
VRPCALCGRGFPGVDPIERAAKGQHGQFVAVAVSSAGGDDIAGPIETIDSDDVTRAYTRRDGISGTTQTIVVDHPQVCWECIERMGELIGIADTLPLRAENEELRAELDRVQEAHDATRARAEQAEEVARDALTRVAVLERLHDDTAQVTKPKARAKAKAG